MLRYFPLFLFLPFLWQCQTPISEPRIVQSVTPENFRVAYVGDIGTNADSHKVLQLIEQEKSGLFILLGDFDYRDDPVYFEKMLNDDVPTVPLLAVAGNHDVRMWKEYRRILERRLREIPEIQCKGEIGVRMRCEYKGLVIALSGVGVLGMNHEPFLVESLKEASAPFKICAWHKNQSAMQAGTKKDETGWEVYEICRREGAMIATGHEHSYSRTHLLSDFPAQKVVNESSELILEKGQTFAFVSGLGGKSVRGQKKASWVNRAAAMLNSDPVEKTIEPWWAKVYTLDQKAKASVLFCDYFVDKDPRKARCNLKTIDGDIIDSFTVRSNLKE